MMITRQSSRPTPRDTPPVEHGRHTWFSLALMPTAACSPWTRADVVIVNTNVDAPAVVA